jgi:hypothetical protein
VTQAQYEIAKDVILDLLGWGVLPEYLVDCGLSREIVYYVFSELNLRLPTNLDLDGLLPYLSVPELFVSERHADRSTILPPSPKQTGVSANIAPRPTLPPSLPIESPLPTPPSDATQRAIAPKTAQSRPSPTPVASSLANSPAAATALTTTNLHDIEQQRRQELLARKAVQASRRSKQASARVATDTNAPPPTPPAALVDQDIEMVSVVPSNTVDDFLKSISPVSNVVNTSGDAADAVSSHNHDLDVGLSEADDIPTAFVASTPSATVSAISIRSDASSSDFRSQPKVSPRTAESSALSLMADPDPGLAPARNGPNKPPHPDSNSEIGLQFSRRGIKRPVAADFVDFEQSPRHGYMNGGSQSYSTQRRKTSAGFASVSEMRRCVIDLSDSEDDGDDDPVMLDYGASDQEPKAAPIARRSTPASAIPSGIGSGSSTPGSILVPATTMTTSPAALTEKEQEIRRMKELIREREERGRMKRLVSVRS